MATTYTQNARLQKPAASDRNWDVPINANTDLIDGMTAIGGLAVAAEETPSSSLSIRIAAGPYIKADGTVALFDGSPAFPIASSSTSCVWLTDAGVVVAGADFPATAHLRLARVVAGPTSIIQVVDERVQCAVAGTGLGFVAKSGDTVAGPLTVKTPGTEAALASFDAAGRKIGFFGAAPTTQAPALTLLVSNSTGIASDAINDVGTTHSQVVLNNNFASLTAKVDALINALKRHGLMGS